MFTSIAGRAVVVTGGTRGIGKAIAGVFARNGAKVLITGRDFEVARAAADELSDQAAGGGLAGADGKVSFVLADVASTEDCRRMAGVAQERLGGIDVLCTNAGIFPDARLEDLTESDLDQVLGINLKGTILSVQACLPALAHSGRGRVIITSSITGPITGFPGWTHYGASKAGQLGFMRSAAIELAPKGITVNAVLPGNVVTERLADPGKEYTSGMTAAIPLGRLGTVDEIAYAALFFATDEAAYITGQSIVVDGGQVLPESPDAIAAISD
jgi:3-oxoacyl-[acyl-carrier protein] reductase